jgi:hypothetical protein
MTIQTQKPHDGNATNMDCAWNFHEKRANSVSRGSNPDGQAVSAGDVGEDPVPEVWEAYQVIFSDRASWDDNYQPRTRSDNSTAIVFAAQKRTMVNMHWSISGSTSDVCSQIDIPTAI